jgi:hypothetical protein
MPVNLKRISIAAAAMLLAVAVLGAVVSFGASRTSQAASPPTLQFGCDYLKREAIDPIVDPAVPHIHEFYGNRSVNADSTYNSLKANPATTCRVDEATSSYWHPAFREGGKVQRPLMIRTYYRDFNGIDPNMRPIPDGLQILATEANGNVRYKCGWRGSPRTTPPVGCTQPWTVSFDFPNCWNPNAGRGPNSVKFGAWSCPSTHPYQFPNLRIEVFYPRPADGTLSAPLEVSMGGGEWGLASQYAHADRMDGDPDAFNAKWLGPCVLNTTSSPSFCSPGRQAP